MYYIVTFLNFRIEAYSATVGSWMARELTEDRGDLLTPFAPLPLPVIGPLMVPFPLPFPLPPFEKKRQRNAHIFALAEMSVTNKLSSTNLKTQNLMQSTLNKAWPTSLKLHSCTSSTSDLHTQADDACNLQANKCYSCCNCMQVSITFFVTSHIYICRSKMLPHYYFLFL